MPEISRFLGIIIAMFYKDELLENWQLVEEKKPLKKIAPLE